LIPTSWPAGSNATGSDALIAEAAIRSRCSVLVSEHLSHGGRINSVEVVNPMLS